MQFLCYEKHKYLKIISLSLLLNTWGLIRLQVGSHVIQDFVQRATQGIERKQFCQEIQCTALEIRLTLAHQKEL